MAKNGNRGMRVINFVIKIYNNYNFSLFVGKIIKKN